MRRLAILGLTFLICSGCAKAIYHWGSYEDNLYSYYKSSKVPEDHEQFMQQLSYLIEQGEKNSEAVPPGLYAEYGYALYQERHYQEAIQQFEKEKLLWPEASSLMDRLIGNVRKIMTEDKDDSRKTK